jgi:hypothetical protein
VAITAVTITTVAITGEPVRRTTTAAPTFARGRLADPAREGAALS